MERRVLGIIGAGAMGTAIIRGLIRGGHLPEEIIVFDTDPGKKQSLIDSGFRFLPDNRALVQQAEGVIIALKPQAVPDLLKEIGPDYPQGKPVLTVAAGISIAAYEESLPPGTPVVRAMPNMPALIGEGVTALAGGTFATMDDLSWAHELLSPLGKVLMVREPLMDAVTGLSGSGPAYVYLFIEALIDAGVRVGLSRDTAKEMAVSTVYGSVRMMQETKEHPAKLREQVTSPGGTTAAALAHLERGAFRGLISDAVAAAAERSQELGKK